MGSKENDRQQALQDKATSSLQAPGQDSDIVRAIAPSGVLFWMDIPTPYRHLMLIQPQDPRTRRETKWRATLMLCSTL